MTSIVTKRLLKEYKDLESSRSILNDSGIYFYFDESNVKKMYAMIIGPDDTPYEYGYYFFEFDFPDNYPMTPPVAKYCTQGLISDNMNHKRHVRFNPNLYICGKVCLSMLNTWQGPGWTPANTIINVLVAIQGLVLNGNPLENEPGYEDSREKEKYWKYNSIIEYANWMISIKGMIEKTPEKFEFFKSDMLENFHKNYEKIMGKIEKRYMNHPTAFEVIDDAYLMICYIDYNNVKREMNELLANHPII